MTPDKVPPCVCRCPAVTHQGNECVCVTPGCGCRGYWPGDVPPEVRAATTRPVAR